MKRFLPVFVALDVVLISLVLTMKAMAFGGTNLLTIALSSLGITIIITSWIAIFPRQLRWVLLIFMDLGISTLIVGDMLFGRYYNSVITTSIMKQASQAAGVTHSISTIFKGSDLLMFVDIPLLTSIFIVTHMKKNIVNIIKSKIIYVAMSCLVGIAISGTTYISLTSKYNLAIPQIYENKIALNNLGILSFHLIDFTMGNQTNATVSVDGLKKWVKTRNVKNDNLYGVGKGKNLIIIQMEAMQQFVIGSKIGGQEITPNLNKLMSSSMYFDNYFSQIAEGNTSDAEFMTMDSLYPLQSGSAYVLKANNTYKSLPITIKEQLGYKSFAFHPFDPTYYNRENMYHTLGFNQFFSSKDYLVPVENVVGMGLSDEQMFTQTLDKIKLLDQPSMFFVISLSGHHPYQIPNSIKELSIPSGQYSPLFEDYLQAQHYADKALGKFIDDLHDAGILDKSVVAIYGDHFGPGIDAGEVYKFQGKDHKPTTLEDLELHRIPLIIRLPNGQDAGINHVTGGQMDLNPTLANIMGMDRSKMLFFGNDLLNTKDGFAAFRHYIPSRSFVDTDHFYLSNDDGQFEHGICYDRSNGKELDNKQCSIGYDKAKTDIAMSDFIIDKNNLNELLKD